LVVPCGSVVTPAVAAELVQLSESLPARRTDVRLAAVLHAMPLERKRQRKALVADEAGVGADAGVRHHVIVEMV